MLEVRRGVAVRSYENTFFRKFANQLNQLFEREGYQGLLLGNPLCTENDSLQIDALLITTQQIIIIDFKNYGGNIELPSHDYFIEDTWYQNNGDKIEIKGGKSRNPYEQLDKQKRTLSWLYHNIIKDKLPPNDKIHAGHTKKIVCFQEPITLQGDIPNQDKLSFFITDSNRFLNTIKDILDVEHKETKLSRQGFSVFKAIFKADIFVLDEVETKKADNNQDELTEELRQMKLTLKELQEKDNPTNPQKQFELAEKYHHGNWDKKQSDSEAFKWYKKSAEQGFADAQFLLAKFYEKGQGIEQSDSEAFKWYKKSAEQGFADAQFLLAKFYEKGQGIEQSDSEAFKWYKKSAEQGFAKAQNNLGVCYKKGQGVEQSYTEAVKWFKKSVEQESMVAQFNLAICYQNGQGVEQSHIETFKWYKKSAEQGYAYAQFELGFCYANGKGIKQSYIETFKWYKKSAEQGYARAQFQLGICYQNGNGVTKSKAEAFKWYKKSAEQGYARAQSQLGVCYQNGQGIEQSDIKAFEWFKKSAEQDNSNGQYNLGSCYANGKGVKQSYIEAVKWYEKSAKQGNKSAENKLKNLK